MTLLLAIVSVLAFGCHSSPSPGPTSSSNQVKIFRLRGKVVATNAAKGEATIDHQAIPGFMGAMTMPYRLKDAGILGELHPGDVITADILVPADPNADTLLDHIVVVAQGRPDYRPTALYHVPAQGDAVPDFMLLNQDGRPIHLGQFRSKTLLVTFIYTQCPLPDFCPRVTRNFAAIDRQLASDPGTYAKTHLICISFDPEHDTPERLRAYAVTYMGNDSKTAFAHWDFAAADKAQLGDLARYFDVGLTPGPEGTINHTLSTTLIGADGKVVRFYPGNEWMPDQVTADVKQAVAGKS